MKIIRIHEFLGQKVCLNFVRAWNSRPDCVTIVAVFRWILPLDPFGGAKKMGFDIGVGRFNSRGCLLVKMGNSFGVSVGNFFCHREPNRIKIFLKRGREFGREGEKGSLEFRG